MSKTTGQRIRRARESRGWTQKDLAAKVRRSQALISRIESGGSAPRALITEVQRVLSALPADASQAAPPLAPEPAPFEPADWTADEPRGIPLRIQTWKRPAASGDFAMVVPIAPDAALVLAGDVAGHGWSASAPALAVRAWVDGWMQAQLGPPRLESLLDALSRALARLEIGLALFAALIREDRSGRHMVDYEAASCGYPPPLLITGPPYRTRESVANIGAPLPLTAQDRVAVTHLAGLAAPWRLVAASDGLLGRLGAGSESDGVRALRAWACGERRDRPPDQELATELPPRDDESWLAVSWARWDSVRLISTANDEVRHGTIDGVVDAARRATDDALAGRVRTILVEALANVRDHAKSPSDHSIVSYRATADGVRLQVTDFGTRSATPTQVASSSGGFAVMRARASHLDVRRGERSGTVIDAFLEWRRP